MELSGRNLSLGVRGSDVALLHSELSSLGYFIPEAETASRRFGDGTRAAVIQFQRRNGIVASGVVDGETARIINIRFGALSATPGQRTVQGRVLLADGTPPAPSVTVRAFDQALNSETQIGLDATTDPTGAYSITYSLLTTAELGTADVRVRAYTQPAGGTQLAESDIYFNVADTAEINLIVVSAAQSGLSEYERLTNDITKLRESQGVAVTDLTADQVQFISAETGTSATRLALYVAAQKLAAQYQTVPAAAFYGLARKGLPSTIDRLLVQKREAQQRALEGAIADNIVPASLSSTVTSILDALAALAASRTVAASTVAGRSSIGDHLTAGGVAQAAHEPFVSAWLAWTGTLADFWTDLATQQGFDAQTVQKIQLSLQLGALTQHAKVVQALVAANVTALRQLVSWDAAQWTTFIQGLADQNGNLPIPADITGADSNAKLANYSSLLVRIIEQSFPAAAYVQPLRQNPSQADSDLIAFVDGNTSFDLRRTPIDAFLQTAASLPNDPARKVALTGTLKKTQRLYRLGTSIAEVRSLDTAGLRSAAAITRGGRASFVAQFEEDLGEDRAHAIYSRAEHAAAVAMNLFARFSARANSLGLPVLPTPAETSGGGQGMFGAQLATPDYESLFGSLDFCDCADCRSVLGPAAYLVDLLHFLSRYPKKDDHSKSALDVLLARRPDLATTELSCENTNTELPYIDLANELMEASIAGGAPKQTTQPADVLAVEPKHEDLRAYDIVARDVYPWALPFDLGATRARGFLGQLDVRRDELMQTFQGPTGASAFAIDGETLGMTPFEVRLATGGLTLGPTVAVAATDTNNPVTLSGGQLVDGVNVQPGQLVLVNDRTANNLPQNGVYQAQQAAWIRAPGLTLTTGIVIPVAGGTNNGKKAYVLTTRFAINLGTDAIAFAELPTIAPGEFVFALAVKAATTGPITLQALQTVDTVALQANDRVLVKDQADPKENGIYVAAAGNWTRTGDTIAPSLAVVVQSGTQAGKRFALATVPVFIPGTTALEFKLTTDDAADVLVTDYWRFWGYEGPPVNFLTDLSSVSTLLARSGMSYDDLTQLLETRYVNPGGSLAVTFAGTSCDLSQATVNLTKAAARRIARFERLRQKLGWTAIDLDRALVALAQPEITDAFVSRLAEIERLRRRFRLSVEEVLAFWAPFETSNADISSLYDRVFLNPKLYRPVDPAFALDPNDRSQLAVANETLAGHRVSILAALGLGAQEFALLTAGDGLAPAETTAALSLENLWKLYRATLLARALRLGLRDFLRLKALAGIDPFQPSTTRAFADTVDALRATGFTVDELAYLFTTIDAPPAFAPSFTAAVVALTAIRDGVARVAAANATPPEGGVDAARAKVADDLAKLPLNPDNVAIAIAIIDRTSQLSDGDQAGFVQENFSAFLDPADARLTGQNQVTDVPTRFEYVRSRLATYIVGRAVVKDRLGDAFRLSPASVEEQIFRYQPAGRPAISAFFDPAWLATTGDVTFDLPLPVVAFYWLHKVSLIAARLGLDESDLHVAGDLVGRLLLGALWIDFTRLPINNEIAHGDPADLFGGLLRLAEFVAVRKRIPKQAMPLHQVLYDAVARAADNDLTHLMPTLTGATGWAEADVAAVAARLGLTEPAAFQSVAPIRRMADCFAAVRRLGVTAGDAVAHFVADVVTIEDADAAKRAAKAKYDEESWPKVATPIQAALREAKRDALISHHLGAGYADDKALFDALLVDVEMGACMVTSRIKQAISSVQLFFQHALMNLEPDVTLDGEARREWAWMKAFRLWEANRKVFLYPENWVDPSLRDDKSPFFKELETELGQQPLTDDAAEEAYAHYLGKLAEVARLHVTGFYRELGKDTAGPIDVLHVFGCTDTVPPKHYYRRREDRRWSAWEPVSLDVETDRVLPFVFNRRLHLFWLVFNKKADQEVGVPKSTDVADVQKEVNAGVSTHFEIQVGWSEHRKGRWSPRRVSQKVLSTASIPKGNSPDHGDPSKYIARAVGDGDDVVVRVIVTDPVTSSGSVDAGARTYVGEFRFVGAFSNGGVARPGGDGTPITVEFAEDPKYVVIAPDLTVKNGNTFVAHPTDPATQGLSLYDYQYLSRTEGPPVDATIQNAVNPVTVTTVTPVNPATQEPMAFTIVPPHNELEFVATDCFVEDALRSFYVEPTDAPRLALGMDLGNTPPGIGDQVRDQFYVPPAPPKPDPGLIIDGMPNIANLGGYTKVEHDAHTNVQALEAILGGEPSEESSIPKAELDKLYRLDAFYHPYSSEFVGQVNRQGVDGLLRREVQILPEPDLPRADQRFITDYVPGKGTAEPNPKEDVDFRPEGAYAPYNWEVFFHIPFWIATRLMQDQQFEAAQKWFHYIFDPTDPTGGADPSRFWKFKPFVDEAKGKPIQDLLALAGDDGADPDLAALQQEIEAEIAAWRKDPFNPHRIARLRPSAYAKAVVMKYIDNLIGWGDQLFRRNTIESINEATHLYVLAAELLGRRPVEVARDDSPAKTWDDIRTHLDEFGDALIGVEHVVAVKGNGGGRDLPPGIGNALYFCVPRNERLLSYWDTVDDRLFKIRNCMNIEGVVQRLPLFEPPIDPALLVRARAAGVDLASALSDVTAAAPFYRFQTMLQRAIDLSGEVRALGGALLAALEKRDGEALGLLRSTHEQALLAAVRDVKQRAVDEAAAQIETIRKQRVTVQVRFDYYSNLPRYIPAETNQVTALQSAKTDHETAQSAHLVAGVARAIPDFVTGISGLAASPVSTIKVGGSLVGAVADLVAVGHLDAAQIASTSAQLSGTNAQYLRRSDDWTMQANVAQKELDQIDKQLAAAEIRLAIAERDLANQDLQIANAKTVDDFLRDKFTNHDLYDWMVSQVAGLYFQAYQLAYDVAKRAERAFRFERPDASTTLIQFGYWDTLKKGLLAGERLHLDLRRMEVAYLEQNRRELELTRAISLAELNPEALLGLKTSGECEFDLEEPLFDRDFPGHYLRRLKSVSVTIPCVARAYASVNATLTLLTHKIRTSKTGYDPIGEGNGIVAVGGIESIATSTAQSDAGLFELNFRDERYLPFEGAGAISRWRLSLAPDTNLFDFATLTDAVLHVRYTARDGGATLRDAARTANVLADRTGSRLLSFRHDFPEEWARFFAPAAIDDKQSLTVAVNSLRLPLPVPGKVTKVTDAVMFVKFKDRPLEGRDDSPADVYRDGDPLKLAVDAGQATELDPAIPKLPKLPLVEGAHLALPVSWTVTADYHDVDDLDADEAPLTIPDPGDEERMRLNPEAIEDIFVLVAYEQVNP